MAKPFCLRALEPPEADIQSGVLHLAKVHPAVGFLIRTNSGKWVIIRPPFRGPGGFRALREQLDRCFTAGYLRPSQVGWVEGGDANTPDALGMMRTGHTLGLEFKTRKAKPTPGQRSVIELVQDVGACGAVIRDIQEADRLFSAWDRQHRAAA